MANVENFLAVTLATSKQDTVPVVISEKFENTRVLDQTFVTFKIGERQILGKLANVNTRNPFMDPTDIGGKNLVYLKTKGQIPNLSESTDATLATIEVIGCREKDGKEIMNLFNSPRTGLQVFQATDEDFEFFFKGMYESPIQFAVIRGSDYLLPMDAKKFFLHTDVIADTGRGKTVLAMLALAKLHGKQVKLKDNKGKESLKNIKTWVIDRDGQFAKDVFGILGKHKELKMFVVKYEEMRVESRKELIALLEREYDFSFMPFKQKVVDVNYWLSMFLEEPYTYEGFAEALQRAIRQAYRDSRLGERTASDTVVALEQKNGETIWETKIKKKLRAPYKIDDLMVKAEQGHMIIVDLEDAEEFQKPIIADYALRKLFDKAAAEYRTTNLEYGMSTIVFIDEAQDYCPEKFDEQWYNRDSKEIIIKIAKQGRKYGLGLMLASQRYASIAKDALTQMNNHFISKVKYGDLSRVKEEHGDDIKKTLANLGPHEFIVKGEICPTSFAIVKGAIK